MPTYTPVKRSQVRHVGDTLTAIAAQLKRPDGTVVDVTSATVRFKMLHATNGTTKVAETDTGVSKVDAANGKVQYAPAAADVNTAGTYHAYFTVESGGKKDTFPVDQGYLEIVIEPDT